MSRHKQNDVRILNPISGRGYTSGKKAQQYVDAERADYVNDQNGRRCLKFRESDPRNLRVETNVNLRITDYDIAASRGLAPLQAIKNLPIACKKRVTLMLSLQTKRSKPRPK